jgi:carboxymethylenebutenolidase
MRSTLAQRAAAVALTLVCTTPLCRAQDDAIVPERVTFPSADKRTTLIGYLYRPARMPAERVPAVVMMHGRGGAYSDRANGVYDASTLSLRHKAWGRRWAEAGYIAVLVDGFGPRGHPQGFPRFSYDSRPEQVSEVAVRPLDAYGALAYLRTRPDVLGDRIGLQGWSNGASAAIVAMSHDAPGIAAPTPESGFRAALAFYPACGLRGRFDERPFRPYAPTLVFHGTADEEVSHRRCATLVEKSRAAGGNVAIKVYRGATHSFDTPSRKRQGIDANADATEDAIARALALFARQVAGGNAPSR